MDPQFWYHGGTRDATLKSNLIGDAVETVLDLLDQTDDTIELFMSCINKCKGTYRKLVNVVTQWDLETLGGRVMKLLAPDPSKIRLTSCRYEQCFANVKSADWTKLHEDVELNEAVLEICASLEQKAAKKTPKKIPKNQENQAEEKGMHFERIFATLFWFLCAHSKIQKMKKMETMTKKMIHRLLLPRTNPMKRMKQM